MLVIVTFFSFLFLSCTCKFIEMVSNIICLVIKICIFVVNEFYCAYNRGKKSYYESMENSTRHNEIKCNALMSVKIIEYIISSSRISWDFLIYFWDLNWLSVRHFFSKFVAKVTAFLVVLQWCFAVKKNSTDNIVLTFLFLFWPQEPLGSIIVKKRTLKETKRET